MKGTLSNLKWTIFCDHFTKNLNLEIESHSLFACHMAWHMAIFPLNFYNYVGQVADVV